MNYGKNKLLKEKKKRELKQIIKNRVYAIQRRIKCPTFMKVVEMVQNLLPNVPITDYKTILQAIKVTSSMLCYVVHTHTKRGVHINQM